MSLIKPLNIPELTNTGLEVRRHFATGPTGYEGVVWTARTAKIKTEDGGQVFEQNDIEAPSTWSDAAVNIVASKYFRGHLGTPERERSVRGLIDRVADSIVDAGVANGYFKTTEDAQAYRADLKYLLVHQMMAFNSPVWFNVGTTPRPQSSACFIVGVEDSMESIMELAATEARLFKGGSGAGSNLSSIRSSKETLSGSGTASGPVSFMRGFDAFAGVIKSGGRCLAPTQKVYTERGPVAVSELAGTDFIVLSYDPPAQRYKAKRATAWQSNVKNVVRVHTDKGHFDVSDDHPFRLSSGQARLAGDLSPGNSLFACAIDAGGGAGYVRVHLRDGRKGKDLLHRMVARDVGGHDIEGLVVHHVNGTPYDNRLDNLQICTQAEHARLHANEEVAEGTHVFQTQDFAHAGDANGMHKSQPFWQSDRAQAYRTVQGEILERSGRASAMQVEAARQKMLNTAFRVMNDGHSIDTFEDYFRARSTSIGPIASKSGLKAKIDRRFGSYDAFKQEVAANNHRVVRIEPLGLMPVFSIEVDCPTIDDKSPESGHNFVIWSGDDRYGSGVVVHNTRRAAKMIMLDVDHPDILDFIDSKAREERKAHDLLSLGYTGGIEGEAYSSVFFQNANHSIRVTDKFMRKAVSADPVARQYPLTARTDGRVLQTVDAHDVLWKAAEAAHFCGDPGVQYDSTINFWHTSKASGPITGSNPCSEYMYLPDTACNLASLNLVKFYRSDKFQVEDFKAAIAHSILAQEILVGMSSYPTPKIAENSRVYRPLGLGYANLGALLMMMGKPYDSVDGRNFAAAITAIMTGTAYTVSGIIAATCGGPFEGYTANRESMMAVIAEHRLKAAELGAGASRSSEFDLVHEARNAWTAAEAIGEVAGFRNAQVTVLAPTGTIAFMMDCDTTGIEPDIALVKYKRLVGGGTMKIVNQSVRPALEKLNYSARKIDEIIKYIEEHETIEGADITPSDLPVFDCAFRAAKGTRSIQPMGHVKMMAAVQPFLSGAISKTVNMPEDATVQDIYDVYVTGWKLGLKAIAIYRDGCKKAQPLSTSKTENKVETPPVAPPAPAPAPVAAPARRSLPSERDAKTHKFQVGQHEGYVTVGMFPDGSPGEVFVTMSKEGSTVSGLMDTIATLTSIALQYNVPLDVLVSKFSHMRFEPSGFTGNRDIPIAKSIVDYVFRWIGLRFLPAAEDETRTAEHPAFSETVLPPLLETPPPAAPSLPAPRRIAADTRDAPPCASCGGIMVRSGSCYACPECGTTSGCS